MGPLTILKTTPVLFALETPHQTMWHRSPNRKIPMPPKAALPTLKNFQCTFWHYPVDSKQLKNHGPQLRSKRTMEKKVIYCVPSFLAHIAQSNTSACLYWRLSIVRILPKSTVHTKRATRGGTRDFQIIFQGKDLGNVLDKAI